jgi:hypothetical protein
VIQRSPTNCKLANVDNILSRSCPIYRPTVGELIVGLILAVLAVPIWHRISRTWDYLLDQIALRSNISRAKRIIELEKQVQYLQEYNEHRALLRLLRKIVNLIVSFGLLAPMVTCLLAIDAIQLLHQISEALHLPALDSAFGEPSESFVHSAFLLAAVFIIVIITIIMRIASMTIREKDDFADPPKTIKKLEERINALKAKGSAQRLPNC